MHLLPEAEGVPPADLNLQFHLRVGGVAAAIGPPPEADDVAGPDACEAIVVPQKPNCHGLQQAVLGRRSSAQPPRRVCCLR